MNFIGHLKEQGITSVFITHNLHHVYSVADRFVVMSHGMKVGDVEKSRTTVEELEDMIIAEVGDQIMQIPHSHKEPIPHEHKYPM
jgi:ABC-type sugar transport system ATPase subunit